MATVSQNKTAGTARVERQIILPLSKAVEISYKSIRLRLSRSLLVTSGIILALAFLMSIQTTEVMIDGMRAWASAAPGTQHFKELEARRDKMQPEFDQRGRDLAADFRKPAAPLPKDTKPFDPRDKYGMDLTELQKDLGMPLFMPPGELTGALNANRDRIAQFDSWLAEARKFKAIKSELTSPQTLQSMMIANGVPTTAAEIQSSHLQTRWLLALALLVAFVGILNSMLMSVTERFREIGTMKCLGALDSFIIKLFLIESLFQGVAGTVLGIIVGMALSFAGVSTSYGQFAWKMVLVGPIMLNVGFCLLIGVVLTVGGAVYPAWQAARMQPIEAMRVET
ncbi:MAG TPA: FtsX-like permease family protein [Tepidisphaeraceae bacterium]|jgi:hypothetical protein